MAWLPNGEKILMLYLFILTEFTNVTDTHTHRHHMMAALMHSISWQKWHHAEVRLIRWTQLYKTEGYEHVYV